jgi:Phage integrase, N-terminal SAM-like domain
MSPLAPVLQAYFTDRVIGQCRESEHDRGLQGTFRLLLAYATEHTRKAPGTLDIADLDASLVAAFLDHLERDRHNSATTRNNRLAALHSLFGYLTLSEVSDNAANRTTPQGTSWRTGWLRSTRYGLLGVDVVRILFPRLDGEGQLVLRRRHRADGEVVGERAR